MLRQLHIVRFLFRFLRNETNPFVFRVNYLLSGVTWLIRIEFKIENVNNLGLEKQTRGHTIFKYRQKYMKRTQKKSECITNICIWSKNAICGLKCFEVSWKQCIAEKWTSIWMNVMESNRAEEILPIKPGLSEFPWKNALTIIIQEMKHCFFF